MKLLVRNLDRATTQQQLLDLFEQYGNVLYCTLIMDKQTGRSKGFGFIEMPKQGDAKAAISNLNGQTLDGSKIRVKKAETKPNIYLQGKKVIETKEPDPS